MRSKQRNRAKLTLTIKGLPQNNTNLCNTL